MDTDVFERVCRELNADDLLVLERVAGHVRVIGGAGRGAAWADSVTARLDDEPLARAAAQGRTIRVGGREPQRVVGPYWATSALLVPVGEAHVVVFGGERLARASDGELLRFAAEAAGACGRVSTDKLLADELEVVHAVRALMSERPRSVVETARHVAEVAAAALSCDIGIVLLAREPEPIVVVAGDAAPQCPADERLVEALRPIAERARHAPLLEQDVVDGSHVGGLELVSRLALAIGPEGVVGILVVGHSRKHPRGFTTLCQRIGRSIADAAEGLIAQALLREELAAERDRFARAARTDPLTGLGNRIAWDDACAAAENDGDRGCALLVADVDGLKETNDRHGHAAGDELVKAAADAVRTAVRGDDVVARLGGDEFGVLLGDGDAKVAEAVAARIGVACERWTDAAPGRPRLRLSLGWTERRAGERLQETQMRADERMRRDKRREHARAAG